MIPEDPTHPPETTSALFRSINLTKPVPNPLRLLEKIDYYGYVSTLCWWSYCY